MVSNGDDGEIRHLVERVKKLEAANKKLIGQHAVIRRALDLLAHDVSKRFSNEISTSGRLLTEQEEFWTGIEGTAYSINNFADDTPGSSKLRLWSDVFSHIHGVQDAFEVGCNVGLNLRAIHQLRPDIRLSAIEINARAADIVDQLGYVDVYRGSIFDFSQSRKWDLVYVRGVLMHLNPDLLEQAYDVINKHAKKYVCFCENFSDQPEVVPYRGRDDLLVSRHFAREFTDAFPSWKIIADGWDTKNESQPSNRDRRWFVMQNSN